MKERDYYVTPKSSAIMRFLWNAAGGDRYLLERATYSDQIKYLCLGGVVFATGVMAALAGGYAFYTIFAPKDENGWLINSPQTILLSTIFGLIWGLIIFNIDRFIVTSTGSGDGTEKITWDEFKSAIPRILMGTIIAITISKPIEIRMFQTEIQSKLIDLKGKQDSIYSSNVKIRFDSRIKKLEDDIQNNRNIIDKKKSDYDISYSNAQRICPQNGTNCPSGTHRNAWQNANLAKTDWETIQKAINPKISSLENELFKLDQDKKNALNKSHSDSQQMDGLLLRIKIAGELDPTISLFITLLFLAIELTPIFFKLMLIKTPYDYLSENVKDLVKAENGIEVRYDYYKDKKGTERHLVINHEAERMIFEKSKLAEIQKELTDYALQKYKVREQKKIDENLDEYITINKKDIISQDATPNNESKEKLVNDNSNEDNSNKNDNAEIENNEKDIV